MQALAVRLAHMLRLITQLTDCHPVPIVHVAHLDKLDLDDRVTVNGHVVKDVDSDAAHILELPHHGKPEHQPLNCRLGLCIECSA
jgi:hypothetical protein